VAGLGTAIHAFFPRDGALGLAMARCFAGGQRPDFANSSFAELFAWSLAQPAAE
jgi:hypothetical protein